MTNDRKYGIRKPFDFPQHGDTMMLLVLLVTIAFGFGTLVLFRKEISGLLSGQTTAMIESDRLREASQLQQKFGLSTTFNAVDNTYTVDYSPSKLGDNAALKAIELNATEAAYSDPSEAIIKFCERVGVQ